MNVFAPDPCPILSARLLENRHVVKMPMEAAQVACTVAHLRVGEDPDLYRPTHQRHPITLAALRDEGYLGWLVAHGLALFSEYTLRFGRVHASQPKLLRAIDLLGADPAARPFPFPADAVLVEGMAWEGCPHLAYRRVLAQKHARWSQEYLEGKRGSRGLSWGPRDAPVWALPV